MKIQKEIACGRPCTALRRASPTRWPRLEGERESMPRTCHRCHAHVTCKAQARRASARDGCMQANSLRPIVANLREKPAGASDSRACARARHLVRPIDKLSLRPALIRFFTEHLHACRRRRFVARPMIRNSQNFACEASRKSAPNQSLCKRVRSLILPRESSHASLFFCASLSPHDKHEWRAWGGLSVGRKSNGTFSYTGGFAASQS